MVQIAKILRFFHLGHRVEEDGEAQSWIKVRDGALGNAKSVRKLAESIRESYLFARRKWWHFPVLRLNSKLRKFWDMSVAIVLFFCVVTVPFRASFEVSSDGFFLVSDVFIDLFFVWDVCMNFAMSYVNEETQQEVISPKLIAQQYARSWLAIDLVSSFPFYTLALLSGNSFDFTPIGRMPKMIKILRLIKLAKVAKVMRHSNRYTSKIADVLKINPLAFRMIKVFFGILLVAHLLVCLVFFVAKTENFPEQSWVSRNMLDDSDAMHTYTVGFYWMIVTMSSTGYGDIYPGTDAERVVIVFAILIGSQVFAFSIGVMGSVVNSMDRTSARFQSEMQAVKEYMRFRRLPNDIQGRIKEYFEYMMSRRTLFDEDDIFNKLSASLRTEVALYINRDIIKKTTFFRAKDPNFVAAVVTRLRPIVVAPGDYLYRGGETPKAMYIISTGSVQLTIGTRSIDVLHDGSYFGEISLLTGQRQFTSARAVSYCDLFELSRVELNECLGEYPEAAVMLHREAYERTRGLDSSAKNVVRKILFQNMSGANHPPFAPISDPPSDDENPDHSPTTHRAARSPNARDGLGDDGGATRRGGVKFAEDARGDDARAKASTDAYSFSHPRLRFIVDALSARARRISKPDPTHHAPADEHVASTDVCGSGDAVEDSAETATVPVDALVALMADNAAQLATPDPLPNINNVFDVSWRARRSSHGVPRRTSISASGAPAGSDLSHPLSLLQHMPSQPPLTCGPGLMPAVAAALAAFDPTSLDPSLPHSPDVCYTPLHVNRDPTTPSTSSHDAPLVHSTSKPFTSPANPTCDRAATPDACPRCSTKQAATGDLSGNMLAHTHMHSCLNASVPRLRAVDVYDQSLGVPRQELLVGMADAMQSWPSHLDALDNVHAFDSMSSRAGGVVTRQQERRHRGWMLKWRLDSAMRSCRPAAKYCLPNDALSPDHHPPSASPPPLRRRFSFPPPRSMHHVDDDPGGQRDLLSSPPVPILARAGSRRRGPRTGADLAAGCGTYAASEGSVVSAQQVSRGRVLVEVPRPHDSHPATDPPSLPPPRPDAASHSTPPSPTPNPLTHSSSAIIAASQPPHPQPPTTLRVIVPPAPPDTPPAAAATALSPGTPHSARYARLAAATTDHG